MRTDHLTVAAINAAPRFLDRNGTLDLAASLIDDAGSRGARFVVFPESFVPGFPYWINVTPVVHQGPWFRRLWDNAVDAADAAPLTPVMRAAAANDVVVSLGVNERAGGTLYNAQVIIDGAAGVVAVRRKLVPTLAERTVWGYGDGSTLRAFPTRVGTVSSLVCWEHAMNLVRQKLILDGAQVHAAAWPSFLGVEGIKDNYLQRVDLLIRHHALTGQCFVVSAMSPCSEEIAEMMSALPGAEKLIEPAPGWSAVAHPNGMLAAEISSQDDDILMAEVDLGDCVNAKYLLDTAGHSGRPEVLSLTVNPAAFQPASGAAEPPS